MSKEALLANVRAAIRDVPDAETPEDVAVAREYHLEDGFTDETRIEQFCERVAEYKVDVTRVTEAMLPEVIATKLAARGVQRLVIPQDIPTNWLPETLELLQDDQDDNAALSNDDLNSSDGVLTGCAVGISQTGTLVLDGGDKQGRRVLTLLPDYHLCVIYEHQVVGLVPEAIRTLEPAVKTGRALTFVSGPSATSDIELNRVEGVHGPRTLELLVVAYQG